MVVEQGINQYSEGISDLVRQDKTKSSERSVDYEGLLKRSTDPFGLFALTMTPAYLVMAAYSLETNPSVGILATVVSVGCAVFGLYGSEQNHSNESI